MPAQLMSTIKKLSDTVTEIITPERAKFLLENMTRNRRISEPRVKMYAKEMQEHRWKLNGETIKIGSDGKTLDGNHRLQACILADTPFESDVRYNIDPSGFDTIDIQKPRTASDVLTIVGCNNSKDVASAYRWYSRIAKRSTDRNFPLYTPQDIRSLWEEDASLEYYVSEFRDLRHLISVAIAAALYKHFSERNEKEADKFFSDLKRGADLDADDSVLVLRDILFSRQSGTNKHKQDIKQSEIVTKVIRAWNHRRAGKSVKMLKGLRRNDPNPQLPKID